MDVAAWLRGLGLERYVKAFQDNEITASVLPRLKADDLRDLGVTLVGHRRQMLDALDLLNAVPKPGGNDSPAPLATPAAAGPLPSPAEAPLRTEGERRQLSVMFCDFVGSTALSTVLDPEDLHEVITAYHSRVAATVAGFGGFVAEFMGDGVLVYFGWPKASEADAELAVQAAIEVISTVAAVEAGAPTCHVRIGIATGLVIVGNPVRDGDTKSRAAMGQTPNLAARLQTLAEPDTIVIDQVTHARIGELFACEALAAVDLKGFAHPVCAWRVRGKSAMQSRFEAMHGSAATPLVGREEEIELLVRRWRQACDGSGRVLLVSGEPGIGKSRLVAELEARLSGIAHTRLRYFCSARYQNSALYPVIAYFEHAAGFERGDTAAERLRKLRAVVSPVNPSEEEIALLADVLSIQGEELPHLNVSPQRKRDMTFAVLNRYVERLALVHPVLMLLEAIGAGPGTGPRFVPMIAWLA